MKVKYVALFFKPEEDRLRLKFCFEFHISHAHLGVGVLTTCGTFVIHASDQAKTSDFSSPGNRSYKTHSSTLCGI